jgi:hypothetical protein
VTYAATVTATGAAAVPCGAAAVPSRRSGTGSVRWMDFEMDAGAEAELAEYVETVTQQAIDATAQAFRDGEPDVENWLKAEFAGRGFEITDDDWLAELGAQIRTGSAVVVVDPADVSTVVDEDD